MIIKFEVRQKLTIEQGVFINSCAYKQAGIIAPEGSNVACFHLKPRIYQAGNVELLSAYYETGAGEIEIDTIVESQNWRPLSK